MERLNVPFGRGGRVPTLDASNRSEPSQGSICMEILQVQRQWKHARKTTGDSPQLAAGPLDSAPRRHLSVWPDSGVCFLSSRAFLDIMGLPLLSVPLKRISISSPTFITSATFLTCKQKRQVLNNHMELWQFRLKMTEQSRLHIICTPGAVRAPYPFQGDLRYVQEPLHLAWELDDRTKVLDGLHLPSQRKQC